MIYDLLPSSIKVLYLKMKTAISLQGYLDALRELLEELEFSDETVSSYLHLQKLLSFQGRQWEEELKKSSKWIADKLRSLKIEEYIGSKKVQSFIKQNEDAIKNGNPHIFQGNSYLEMQFNLLEQASNIAANYGSYGPLKTWCQQGEMRSKQIILDKDPLPDKNNGFIQPDSEDGDLLEKALGHGFIQVEIIPPNEFNPKKKYLINQGDISFSYPIEIQECRNRTLKRVNPEIQDKQPALLLHELLAYAYWKDWLDADNKFPEQGSEKSLNAFYVNIAMRSNLFLAFRLKGGPENLKEHLFKILDRFLIYIMQEVHQKPMSDKDRAEKHAYGLIKTLLMSKNQEDRSRYTYEEITKIILDRSELELLPFRVCREHCSEACKKFAKNHGWIPKRKAAQQKRVSPTYR